MLQLSVCLEMYWRDVPYPERMRRVKALGYQAYEFWGWKDKDLDAIAAAQAETGLALAIMCMEPNWGLVERANEQALVEGFGQSLQVARRLGCSRLICVPGISLADESWEIARRRVVSKAKVLAGMAEDGGVTVVLEPLNPLVDHKGAWLTRMSEAFDVVQEVGSPNVKILMDLYHQQVTEGNLIANLTQYAPWIGHFHSAGVPGRHELTGGEIDYRAVFSAIRRTGYDGFIGLEYAPAGDTAAGLKQAQLLL
jgi:hydroxypyruvate isomerase